MRTYQRRSSLIEELQSLLDYSGDYANFENFTQMRTKKHPQTIGKLKQTHASLKTSLKMACGEYRRQWRK